MTINSAENNKRVVKNTLWLYGRMLFSMVVSLYTSRLVLDTLGEKDFGLHAVVGGIVAMFSILSGTMSTSVTRFLTFELGKGNSDRLKKVFSTSLSIHLILAVVVLIFIETIGVWFLNTRMNIPADRMIAANWVFQFSILTFILGIVGVPYGGIIIAHEKMTAFAYLGIANVVLKLLVVLFISKSLSENVDKLIMYALLLAVISILLQSITWVYCRKNFEETRYRFELDKSLFKEIGSFAGWSFFGTSAVILKNQGVDILLNIFGGVTVNAARGIATTVSGAVSGFAGNFMAALNPQIIKAYASKEYGYMHSMVERGSRFSYYVILIFAVPILIETKFILTLWLKEFPAHTVSFTRLVLVLVLVEVLSNTLITMQSATGKIRNYQVVVGGILLLNFPISYLVLKAGFPPESPFVVAICISFCCMIVRLVFLKKTVELSISRYLQKVLLNVAIVTALSSVIPLMLYFNLLEINEYLRFVIITAISGVSTMVFVYFVGCNTNERRFIRQKLLDARHKFAQLIPARQQRSN